MAVEFAVPQSVRVEELIKDLVSQFPLRDEGVRNITREYYDTFDSRLFRKDLRFIVEKDVDSRKIILRSLQNPTAQRVTVTDSIPRFAGNFNSGPFLNKIAPVLGVRALIPQLKIKTRIHRLRYEDRQGKTCLYLSFENPRVELSSDHYRLLGKRIYLSEIKGFNRPFERIRKYLSSSYPVTITEEDQFVTGMRLLGKEPGSYSSKLKLKLDPDKNTGDALNVALSTLFQAMLVNENGIVEDIDSEFLHDFRVAVRRTRSAIGQVKHTLRQKDVDKYRREFGWLGTVTGDTRDWDVYLIKFLDYENELPKELHAHLEPFAQFLQRKRDQAHQDLVQQLNSARYKKLKDNWREFLTSPIEYSGVESNAKKPAKQVANTRIWKIYRRIMKESNEISEDSPYMDLHELRISCKKLRYLLEIFQSFYPRKKIKILINRLKQLQDTLGDFCDYHVQIESFSKFEQQMAVETGMSTETEDAINKLIEVIATKQQEKRLEFTEKFQEFSSEKMKNQFRDLFKKKKPDQK